MKWTRVIFGQLIAIAGVSLIAVLIDGAPGGISAVLAGLCCVIPNAVMFAGLYFNDRILKKSGFAALFVLEFVKLALTIVLMVISLLLYKQVIWYFFLASFVVALKSYIFLLSRIES